MKIDSIKNINITTLFSEPLNPILITQNGLLDLFKTGNQQQEDLHTFVEAPGLKVLIFPNLKKEIIFEGVRVLVNDKSEVIVEKSQIVDDFQKVMSSNMIDRNKIAAYGFNYDIIIRPESDAFKITDFVGGKIAQLADIKSAGFNILFDKDNITYVLEIKPLGKEKKFIAHLNTHFNMNKLPDSQELKKQIQNQFEELKKIIQKI